MSGTNRIQKFRHQAFRQQEGKCFYCGNPMWLESLEQFISEYQLTKRQGRFYQCTAEHLEARTDGGSNAAANIVAACKHCNQTRHRRQKALSPEAYRKHVGNRVEVGRWLTNRLLERSRGVIAGGNEIN